MEGSNARTHRGLVAIPGILTSHCQRLPPRRRIQEVDRAAGTEGAVTEE